MFEPLLTVHVGIHSNGCDCGTAVSIAGFLPPPPPPFNPLWYFKASRGFALIPSGRLGNLRTPQCETPELNGAGQTLDLFGGF